MAGPYRVAPPPPPDPWLLAWDDLARRRFLALTSVLPAIGAVFLLRMDPAPLAYVALIMAACAFIVCSSYSERFRCPGCAATFCRAGLRHNTFARRCMHCGLARGTPKSG